MQVKRKRSDSELSYSSTSTASLSSPPRPYHSADHHHQHHHRAVAPTHLPSRTLKRHRDNRPSDEEVHQKTLNILYTAAQQQQHQQPSHTIPPPQPPFHPLQQPQDPHRQSSLHRFWNNLPAPRRAPSPPPPVQFPFLSPPYISTTSTSCEDCSGPLSGVDDDDGDEDISMDDAAAAANGYGYASHMHAATACLGCGRRVCSHCSISADLAGRGRRCLMCAGRR
ncbi:hypothetical protein F4778DRAFT_735621 [Xylariomycetidae sp. FL2044]|nr:hypothetical protein F4778DRAFT_735621 [Xylariomycetidae sp. FL2044]